VLQQEQAGFALNAARFAAGSEAVDFHDSHGDAQAHTFILYLFEVIADESAPTNSCIEMNLIHVRKGSVDLGQYDSLFGII
jgi:hypothetical protein